MAGFVEGGGAPEGGAPPIGPATPIETLVSQVNGSLELITNLPVTVSDCDERLLIGLSCGDQDGDGLVDQWEDALLESLKPVFRFHVDEPILQDSSPSLLQLGRVSASQSSPDVFLHIVTLFDRAEGLCLAFPETRGDLELVVIRLSAQASGAYRVTGGLLPPRALTGWRTFEAPTTVISDPQVGARWVIYSIKNQHTLYLDRDHCTRSTSVCGDLCGPNSAGASSYDRLVEIINVGEPARPLVTGLDSLGYPNEQVWRGGHFCGGASQSRSVICADSSIVELLNRPFGG